MSTAAEESGGSAANASAAEASSGVNSAKFLKWGLIGGGLSLVLYLTRLRNPLWAAYLGPSEHNLQLADSEASLPLNAMWDSRSANDSMKSRLSSMENHLGNSLSFANTLSSINEVDFEIVVGRQ